MKYEVGDRIVVLHSDEEGKVIEILNDKMVLIEVRGVKFPAYMDQIDFPYFKMFTQKKAPEKKKIHIDQVKKEKSTLKKKVADGVFIKLFPVYGKDVFGDEVVDKFKIYLINFNEEAYRFQYKLFFQANEQFQLTGLLHSLEDFYLHDIEFEDLNDGPSFQVEFSLEPAQKNKVPYWETTLKLRGKQVFKQLESLQQTGDPALNYPLFIHYPDKQEEPKVDLTKLESAGFRFHQSSSSGWDMPASQSLIDLHIDKLMDHWEHLNPAEILDLQLNRLDKELDRCVWSGQHSLLIVHGIGTGALRHAVHEKLKLSRDVKSFVHQHHPFYGYGATEVYFKASI
jgi:hypothetical protein